MISMLLKIKVNPGSEGVRIKLEKEREGQKGVICLKIWLKSQPEKGKANKELSKLLKDLFGDYTFVSGATSREKFIKVDGDIDNVIKKISKFIKKEPRELSYSSFITDLICLDLICFGPFGHSGEQSSF